MWVVTYEKEGQTLYETSTTHCLWSTITVIEKIMKGKVVKIEPQKEEMKLVGKYTVWEMIEAGLLTVDDFQNSCTGMMVKVGGRWYDANKLDKEVYNG